MGKGANGICQSNDDRVFVCGDANWHFARWSNGGEFFRRALKEKPVSTNKTRLIWFCVFVFFVDFVCFNKKKLFFVLHIMFLFLSIPILYIYLLPILAQLKMLCFFSHFTHSCEHFAHPTLHVGFKVFCAIFHLRGLHSQ